MSHTLTPTQHAILSHAIDHREGRVDWFPDHIKGGARKKVLTGLMQRNLIHAEGEAWHVDDAAYEALGRAKPSPVEPAPDSLDTERDEAQTAPQRQPSRLRANSKQALVIQMLERPEGATIDQLSHATGWQKHTVRGTLSGALKKKLGLKVISEKSADGERLYRIAKTDHP
ncbi:DUF3489 domain-containing protein [Hahella aquimaris]|uniref:DUF3489 domain-containing protein n=1 Tax=Hahella sp. HNIBRBA332 TaxID=3015983 RepID=UPI00273CA0A9|nr:DUF3489 domain-containing protein [Hahella sp. HNIBRBA332]WLQ13265.1 DUF3489 domain-containing protein [Hahella sp. HNIBRBA332]